MTAERASLSDLQTSAASFVAALEKARAERVPVMALRPDHRFPDEMDDIVVCDVKTFRAEAMSDTSWWMACHFANGEEITFGVSIGKNPKRLVVHVTDKPAVWRDWDELYHEARDVARAALNGGDS